MAAEPEHEVLTVGRARDRDLEPSQGAVSAGGAHQARPRAVLHRGRARGPARRRRPAQRPGALSERHRRRVLLSEAGAAIAAVLAGCRRAALSLGPDGPGDRADESRPRSCGWPTSRVSSCTRTRCVPTTSTIPTSCASISIRCRAWSGLRFARSPAWCRPRSRISAWSDGPRHRARAGSTSTCASSNDGRSTRSVDRRWRWHARSSGARRGWPRASGGKRNVTACSWTTTRTPRIGRWPARIPCDRGRMRACRRRCRGTRSRSATRPTSRWPRCRRGLPRSEILTPAWTAIRA